MKSLSTVEHLNLFNNDLMSISNSTKELYIVSKLSYPEGVVIIIRMDNVISTNEKVTKTKSEN